jgi:hypothetical protein
MYAAEPLLQYLITEATIMGVQGKSQVVPSNIAHSTTSTARLQRRVHGTPVPDAM